MTIWTKSFWLALAERVLATFIATFISVAGLDAIVIGDTGIDSVNWVSALLSALVAAGLSALKGILANLGTNDGPSLTHAEQVQPPLPNAPAT